MSSSPTSATPGELLDGRYRLGPLLGSGGMATVYRADDEHLGRTVAVKLFRPEPADASSIERRTSETRLLASLRHPSLVTLFDAKIAGDGHSYLVMEYIDGPTLGARVAQAPLSPDDTAAMALDLTEALHVVHEAHVVHRDIKPSNILLDPVTSGNPRFRAKLADFGVARLTDSARITMPGTVIGTAAYLSPEQVRGAEPAAPSDIYSLGLVLIEALTGQRVYPQTTLHGALLARMHEPASVPGMFGHRWQSLLTAMTADHPDDRPTARELTRALRSIAEQPSESDATVAEALPVTRVLSSAPTEKLESSAPGATYAAKQSPPRRWLLPVVLVSVLLVVGSGIGVWGALQNTSAPAPPTLPTDTTSPEPASPPTQAPTVDPVEDVDTPADSGSNGNGNRGDEKKSDKGSGKGNGNG